MSKKLDAIDKRILDELQQNGRLSMVELASRVHLTKTPCTERVRRLERTGMLAGYHAVLHSERAGFEHVTVVHVNLSSTDNTTLHNFNIAVADVQEVQTCMMIAGPFDYMLKVRTRNMKHEAFSQTTRRQDQYPARRCTDTFIRRHGSGQGCRVHPHERSINNDNVSLDLVSAYSRRGSGLYAQRPDSALPPRKSQVSAHLR